MRGEGGESVNWLITGRRKLQERDGSPKDCTIMCALRKHMIEVFILMSHFVNIVKFQIDASKERM